MNLTDINTIKRLQKKYSFAFKKGLGQNFLCDQAVIDNIVASSGADDRTGVLEIGPGIGVLTKSLCAAAKKVVAVEIDTNLLDILKETLADCQNLSIINADVLKLDLSELFKTHFSDCERICIAANLPYYITTPIITSILELELPVDSMVFMMQKEVAKRICASPGKKDYGSLTILCNYYSETQIVCEVPARVFIPAPKVDSAVVLFKLYKEKPIKPQSQDAFFKTVHAAFGQRRKTLANAISNSGMFSVSKNKIIDILSEMGINENVRAEQLSLEQMSKLSDIITKN